MASEKGWRRATRLSRALILAGACLVAAALGARTLSLAQSQAGLASFRAATAPTPTGVPDQRAPAAGDWRSLSVDSSHWAATRLAAWREALALAVPPPAGVLRIPRLGLEVPVWPGIDEPTLNRGIGEIPDTAAIGEPAGNSGLAGHRDGFFRVLEEIATGDAIEVETAAGVQRFTVTRTWIVDPSDVAVLAPTAERSLTLVTCYPFHFVGHAPERFVVRASATAGTSDGRAASGGPAAAPPYRAAPR